MIKAVIFLIILLLKIIGVLLLVGLLLFACLLFVPVRYTIQGENSRTAKPPGLSETEKKANRFDFKVQINASWFLHLIRYTFDYSSDGISNTLRVFGLDLQKLSAKWRSHRKRSKQKNRRNQENRTKKTEQTKPDAKLETLNYEKPDSKKSDLQESDLEKPGIKEYDFKESDMKKPDTEKIVQKKTGQKKKRIRDRLQAFHKEFTDQANRLAAAHLWKELLFLLRSFKPRKLKADLAFSLADPALTGYLLGLFSMFPYIYKYPCHIVPDFHSEDVYVEGELFAKGKITVVVFLISLLRLWRDKEFKYVFNRVTGRG